jgi:hypothetical protein
MANMPSMEVVSWVVYYPYFWCYIWLLNMGIYSSILPIQIGGFMSGFITFYHTNIPCCKCSFMCGLTMGWLPRYYQTPPDGGRKKSGGVNVVSEPHKLDDLIEQMTNQSCGCIWILIQAPYPLALESKTQENGVGVHIPRCKAVCDTFGDWKHDRSSLAHTRRNNFQEEVSWPQLLYSSLLDVMSAELSDRWLGSDTWNQCRQCIDIYGSLYTYHIYVVYIV